MRSVSALTRQLTGVHVCLERADGPPGTSTRAQTRQSAFVRSRDHRSPNACALPAGQRCLVKGKAPEQVSTTTSPNRDDSFPKLRERIHAPSRLRPLPPKRKHLFPGIAVRLCPERGSGGVPFVTASSHVHDCEKTSAERDSQSRNRTRWSNQRSRLTPSQRNPTPGAMHRLRSRGDSHASEN